MYEACGRSLPTFALRTSTDTSPSRRSDRCGSRPDVSCPFSTTSASSLNVSGTMPVYDASTTLPDSMRAGRVVLHLELVFERVALPQDRAGHDVAVQLQRLAFPLPAGSSSPRRRA